MPELSANIAMTLLQRAAHSPNALALTALTQGGRREDSLSYHSLATLAQEVAQGLAYFGILKGHRVVLLTPPSKEFYALVYGMLLAGVVPVLLDPGMGVKAMGQCISIASPQALIGNLKALLAARALKWLPATSPKILVGPSHLGFSGKTFERLSIQGAKAAYPLPQQSLDDVAAILYTSGATGRPKGVIYQHRHFMAQLDLLTKLFRFSSHDSDLATFPLFGLFSPALGMRVVIPDMDFSRPGAINGLKLREQIIAQQCTSMFASPALVKRMVEALAPRRLSIPSLKQLIVAGAPIAPKLLRECRALLGSEAQIYAPYGATEALPVAVINQRELPTESTIHGTCLGRVAPQTLVKIIQISEQPIARLDANLELPSKQIGEIIVKGPQVTSAYFGLETATAASKIQDQLIKETDSPGLWHRMGDLGYFDSSGRLWFVGRKKHRVQLPTSTLYPIPVEGHYLDHSEVNRAALVGILSRRTPLSPIVAIVIEPKRWGYWWQRLKLAYELRQRHHAVQLVLFHRSFPVDRRHNAKIFREELAAWAGRRWEFWWYEFISYWRRRFSRQDNHQTAAGPG